MDKKVAKTKLCPSHMHRLFLLSFSCHLALDSSEAVLSLMIKLKMNHLPYNRL